MDSQVCCRTYFADGNVEARESEDLEDWEEDEDAVYCELRCEACNHEIELGHAPPNRQGRVWPCEGADFNPWKTWPQGACITFADDRDCSSSRKRTLSVKAGSLVMPR